MASIRTARVLAAVAALPLAATLFTGVASADTGSIADDGSNAAAASIGGGRWDDNNGNMSTTQQQAVGFGASNRSNTAQVRDSAFTTVNQGDGNVVINFTNLW
jgi:hypothetical protein